MREGGPHYLRYHWKHSDVASWVDFYDFDGVVFGALGVDGDGRFIAGHQGQLKPDVVGANAALELADSLDAAASEVGTQLHETRPARSFVGKLKDSIWPMWDYTTVRTYPVLGVGLIREIRIVRRLNSNSRGLVFVVADEGTSCHLVGKEAAQNVVGFIRRHAVATS